MLLSNFITKKQLKRIILFLKKRLYFSVFIGRFTKKRVIYTSIPKAGTNLLFNLLNEIPYYRFVIRRGIRPWLFKSQASYLKIFYHLKKGAILKGHIPFNSNFNKFISKKNNYQVILLVRDPRDVIVSIYHYIESMDKSHKSHQFFSNISSKDERINAILFGHSDYFEPLTKIYNQYLMWEDLDNCYTIKYEDLIDIKNEKLNPKIIFKRLKEILQINISDSSLINYLKDESNSNTKRTGKYGEWKNFFNAKQKKYINEELSGVLIRLGYETQ